MSLLLTAGGVTSANVRPPLLATWTQVNAGSVTFSNFQRGVNMSYTATATSEACTGLVTSFSSGQTATAHIICQGTFWQAANNIQYGMMLRQSSDGKLATFCVNFDCSTKAATVASQWRASATAITGTYESTTSHRNLHDVWIRCVDTGVNRVFYISKDPTSFGQAVHSVSRTDYLTADQAGFYVNYKGGSGCIISCSLVSWQVT